MTVQLLDLPGLLAKTFPTMSGQRNRSSDPPIWARAGGADQVEKRWLELRAKALPSCG